MVPPAARLDTGDVACWVIKTRTAPDGVDPRWAPGEQRSLSRCVRRSYRLDLMAPGQLCLLWLSGQDGPGVHAVGRLTRAPQRANGAHPAVQGTAEPTVGVLLHRLAEPVPRAELAVHPVFARAEVVRTPAGSNPSYLRPAQLAVLRERLTEADLRGAGWS